MNIMDIYPCGSDEHCRAVKVEPLRFAGLTPTPEHHSDARTNIQTHEATGYREKCDS